MSGCAVRRVASRVAAKLAFQAGWLALLLASLPTGAKAAPPADTWVVDNWQVEDGLPHNTVTCVLQSAAGYLWVGTLNGLARFDGVRFTTFRTADNPALRSNRILCLHEDVSGVLWIGTDGGGLVSWHNGLFTSFGSEAGLSSETVLCLEDGAEGELWIGTDSGLNLRQAERFSTFFKTDGLPDDRVNALCLPRGSGVLCATGKGLSEYRRQAFKVLDDSILEGAPPAFNCLRAAREGGFWAGGESGLFYAPGVGAASKFQKLPTTGVLAVLERRDGEVWFGTRAGEVRRRSNQPGDLASEIVWRGQYPVAALCEDREGNVWLGATGDGLRRVKRRRLRLVPLPSTQNGGAVVSFYLTRRGGLGVVTADKGLYGWQGEGFALMGRLPLPDGVGIQTVCEAQTGGLWVGTAREGLFECVTNSAWQYSERDGLSDSGIEVLRAEADGGLWIGTRNGGLNYFKDRKVTRLNTPWGFQDTFACALERDPQGNLWIGTSGDGLFRLTEGRFTGFSVDTGLPSDNVTALHADATGTLWVGTDKGLCRVKDGQVTAFQGGSGLPVEAVLQLCSDHAGNLWAGSASRILRANKEQLEAFAAGRTPFAGAVSYGKEDGLPALQCLPRVQCPGARTNPGGIWFATSKGLVLVDPEGEPWNPQPPPVVLEGVFVDNASVPFSAGVRVVPGKGSLRFEYTALSLTAPGKVSFRYQLTGFDRGWSEPSPAREVRYPNVPPGEYQFCVVACNNDGVWNETGATVAIIIAPFWWKTIWFRLSVVGLVAVAAAAWYRLRQVRRREIERLRIRIASDLHDDIGSSLWSITLLSRMLTKHGKLGAEERQDLDEIHRIAVQTSNSIRDIIWLINPAFDTVQDFVARTKDFAAIVMRGVDYRMSCEGADLTRKLPFDLRHNLFLLFKEALTNIARHANATVVEVRIEERGELWQLTIQDNGVGFDPTASTGGNGLRNLRTRAERMGATLDVRSQPGQGTTLVLSLPPP